MNKKVLERKERERDRGGERERDERKKGREKKGAVAVVNIFPSHPSSFSPFSSLQFFLVSGFGSLFSLLSSLVSLHLIFESERRERK